MRACSRRNVSRGNAWLASVAASHINASSPAFCAVMLRAPPRMNRAVATVRLPARRLTKTFSPLTSNSVTSAAALSATALTFSVSGWPGCPGFGCDTLGASLPFVASCARPTKLGAYVNPVLSTNAKLKIQLLINFRISFIALLNLLPVA